MSENTRHVASDATTCGYHRRVFRRRAPAYHTQKYAHPNGRLDGNECHGLKSAFLWSAHTTAKIMVQIRTPATSDKHTLFAHVGALCMRNQAAPITQTRTGDAVRDRGAIQPLPDHDDA
jgi:hypothetical protein